MKRNTGLDIAKGIGIILVVLGHVMSPVMDGVTLVERIYKIIYTFHMPLFFFVSGYLATKLIKKEQNRITLVKQRALRMMIPYVVWAVIYYPMKIVMKSEVRFDYEYSPVSILFGNNPDGEMWFLYVLFVLCVITIFFVTQKNLVCFACVTAVVSIFAVLIPSYLKYPSISLSFSLYQTGFFFAGLIVATRLDYNKFVKSKLIFALSATHFCAYSVLITILGESFWYLKAVAAASGIYIILFLSACLTKTPLCKPIAFLGRYSMEIYIIHAPILVVGRTVLKNAFDNVYIYIVLLSVLAIGLSLLAAGVVRKIKWARLLLFGSK